MELKEVDFGSHGVIYVEEGEERPTVTEWPNPATEELLKILRKYYRTQGNDTKFGFKRILYEHCSLAMRKKGFRYAAAQCENKWKSLKRRFLTCLNRSRTGKGRKKIPYRKQLFDDEIEYLLQFEKSQFKKDVGRTKRNLRSRRGLNKDMDQDEGNDESDENDHKYTAKDEKLVQRVLRGSEHEDQKHNVFSKKGHRLYPQQKKSESSTTNYLPLVRDLTEAMISNVKANNNILESHSASYEQILVCLDSLDRKEDEKIEIGRKMLEQRKIQNNFLAKILQKLG
ncbi:unnamed protein product [Ceutorhynchus assimilis]|uniref:Myb/SANT-like DNA-binding domain-containing protein n=1 Tax=Ceutorhynchus assimilis TaxID=467358 RepID=A0A9N9MCB0_9CUCU|nr:unnamed protein product [Ceutorhynchus assimilis]